MKHSLHLLRARSSPRAAPPPSARVPHEARPDLAGQVLVEWRIRAGLPTLRTWRVWRRLDRAFQEGSARAGFTLLRYSIRADRLHLLVQVRNRRMLSRGLQALGIRLSKSFNATLGRRRGRVFAERYRALALEGPASRWMRARRPELLASARQLGRPVVRPLEE